MSGREYLTTREVANNLGVALSTVQVWVETGVLPAWKTAGGHRRIPPDAVAAMRLAQDSARLSGPYTVLVVEDDPLQRELYVRHFADWQLPLTLLTAEDGLEGLLLIGRHAPDLVIADLVMPGMDGFWMLRRLRQLPGEMPEILVVSALSEAEIAEAGGVPEAIPVYPKPIPFSVLRSLIEQRLARGISASAKQA